MTMVLFRDTFTWHAVHKRFPTSATKHSPENSAALCAGLIFTVVLLPCELRLLLDDCDMAVFSCTCAGKAPFSRHCRITRPSQINMTIPLRLRKRVTLRIADHILDIRLGIDICTPVSNGTIHQC